MLINQSVIEDLFITAKSSFASGFELVTPQWKSLAMLVKSNSRSNRYPWLGHASSMREWIGDRVVDGKALYSYSIENLPFESTIGINKDDIQDDQYGIYAPMFKNLGEVAALHPDELSFGLLANGTTEPCYDEQPMFSALHPGPNGGTQSNLNSAGGGPYWYLADLTGSIKPLVVQMRSDYSFVSKTNMQDSDHVFMKNELLFGVDARLNVGFGLWQKIYASNQTLNETNVESAWNAMSAFRTETNQPMKIRPSHLIVPTNLEFAALRLLQATLASGETNIHANRFQVIASPFLPLT